MDFTQNNPLDPLKQTTTCLEREFVNKIGQMCDGVSSQYVKVAAINILLQAIRADHAKARQAVDELDYLVTKAKDLLLQHFYPDGSRQNIFPFTQNVNVPLQKLREDGSLEGVDD